MSVEIEGLDEFNRRLTEAVRRYPRKRDMILSANAELLRGAAARNTPVDTGTLRNAWMRARPSGGAVEVYNNTEYVRHVEWGHRTKDGGLVRGAKMLHNAVKECNDEFQNNLRDILTL